VEWIKVGGSEGRRVSVGDITKSLPNPYSTFAARLVV
jgi:hypothetical protein